MRITLSEGPVNIFNLAKNAGTSIDQIEPLSSKMAITCRALGVEMLDVSGQSNETLVRAMTRVVGNRLKA
jgi:hypothetical protein